jgi:dTDP-4-dehydrorhamnose reductase
MRHVVIIGSNGQLGTDLQPACATSRHAADHAQIDVSDFGKRAVLLL